MPRDESGFLPLLDQLEEEGTFAQQEWDRNASAGRSGDPQYRPMPGRPEGKLTTRAMMENLGERLGPMNWDPDVHAEEIILDFDNMEMPDPIRYLDRTSAGPMTYRSVNPRYIPDEDALRVQEALIRRDQRAYDKADTQFRDARHNIYDLGEGSAERGHMVNRGISARADVASEGDESILTFLNDPEVDPDIRQAAGRLDQVYNRRNAFNQPVDAEEVAGHLTRLRETVRELPGTADAARATSRLKRLGRLAGRSLIGVGGMAIGSFSGVQKTLDRLEGKAEEAYGIE